MCLAKISAIGENCIIFLYLNYKNYFCSEKEATHCSITLLFNSHKNGFIWNMSENKECIVLFPVYKPLDADDKKALTQAIKMTPHIDKAFIMSDTFIVDESFDGFTMIPHERFNEIFFANMSGYNHLMLDTDFYNRFRDYKYILIHQTDAFLFKPDLLYWCNKNYDYIGAPWLNPYKTKKRKLYELVLTMCPWIYSPFKSNTTMLGMEVCHYVKYRLL